MSNKYRTTEFASRIGRAASTVRRWERDGLIQSKRLPSGHRYFDDDDVRKVLGEALEKRRVVVYCRVSSPGQKDDLKSQVEAMETYCLGAGIAVDEWIHDIGGGMNFKRKKFLSLMDSIANGEVGRLIVAHKDRLVRFGFDLINHIAEKNGCTIEIVNQESLSPQEEMTEDLLSIVHTFSCRLYGIRKIQTKNRVAAMPPFPLEQWFDLSQKISKGDADLVEAQMVLYALKDGLDPDSPECKKQYRAMRNAVREHNKKFET